MEKLLRINMNKKSAEFESVPEPMVLFGGRGTVAAILSNEVDPTCDALGPDNKLIICPGMMGNTSAPCSGRISIGGKSPLTGTIKEANAGGMAAKKLAALDIYAIVVEGLPQNDDKWHLLVMDDSGAKLVSASKYIGMNNYELVAHLQKDFGKSIATISIGQAGERGYFNSTVQMSDPEGRPARAAARGGLGALMGSKGLKAVVISTAQKLSAPYQDKEGFRTNSKAYTKAIMDNPVSGQGLPALGTAVLVNATNAQGILPTNNYRKGCFEQAEAISGEHIAVLQGERKGNMTHRCSPGCVIQCSNVYHGPDSKYLTSGFEYETIGLMGANCGIDDIDSVALMDQMCDDLGIDTMETGVSIGVCMEAGKLNFGDAKGAIALVQEMKDDTGFGKILGQGTLAVGTHLGVERIPVVKGQALAAYDPRGLKGTGVTYATSPMGADHTAGNSLGDPSVEPSKKEGQVGLSTQLQVGMCLFDNLGMCIFSGFCLAVPENLQLLVNMVAARFGGQWDVDRLMGIAVQTIAMEKAFNKKAGFTAKDDKLPDFFYTETLDSVDTVFDITEKELKEAIPF
ncbi:MAG: aldehyde ferredoxin oxidoreductase C-terminal domain-containing protein [Desulfobacterium sp.]